MSKITSGKIKCTGSELNISKPWGNWLKQLPMRVKYTADWHITEYNKDMLL